MTVICSLQGLLSHLVNAYGLFDSLFVAYQLFIIWLVKVLEFIEILEFLNDVSEDFPFLQDSALRATIVQFLNGLDNLLFLKVIITRNVNPFLTGPLVALHPVSMSLLHAQGTVLIVGVILVTFDAKDIVAITAVLLRLKLGGAHAAFEAALTSVLLFVKGLIRNTLQLTTNGMIDVLA